MHTCNIQGSKCAKAASEADKDLAFLCLQSTALEQRERNQETCWWQILPYVIPYANKETHLWFQGWTTKSRVQRLFDSMLNSLRFLCKPRSSSKGNLLWTAKWLNCTSWERTVHHSLWEHTFRRNIVPCLSKLRSAASLWRSPLPEMLHLLLTKEYIKHWLTASLFWCYHQSPIHLLSPSSLHHPSLPPDLPG